jgi:hypothetical protein
MQACKRLPDPPMLDTTIDLLETIIKQRPRTTVRPAMTTVLMSPRLSAGVQCTRGLRVVVVQQACLSACLLSDNLRAETVISQCPLRVNS